MRVTEIHYERVWNTGNYTSQRYGATAIIESDDDLTSAVYDLKDQCDEAAEFAMRPKPEPKEEDDDDDIPY